MFEERLEALRERSRSLMKQLKPRRETPERPSRKRERDEAEEESVGPGELLTVTRPPGPAARGTRSRTTVRFADICEDQTDIQQSTSEPFSTGKHRQETAAGLKTSELFEGRHRSPAGNSESCFRSKGRSGLQSRVRFQSNECEDEPVTDAHRLRPLLGYDWIAGVLETDDSVMERSDDFFDGLRAFRSLNKDECVQPTRSEFSEDSLPGSPPLGDGDVQQVDADTHQCTFSYRINNRLFAVPLRAEENCPVCKRHKSSHPHTAAEPALIRVSIPRSAVLPPYKYRAHRRCSFDPSDSLGLPSHCLSGWSNTGQITLPPPSGLDLHGSVGAKDSGSVKELENLSEAKTSGNGEQMADVSRLARHNFQHFSAKRKASGTSHR